MKESNCTCVAITLFLALSISPVIKSEKPQRNLIMPSELVDLAEKNGYTQIDNFYDSCFCIYPPFVYGSQDPTSIWIDHMGAAFFCRKAFDSADERESYYLILASRSGTNFDLEIDAIIEEYHYPRGGFSLYFDTVLTLDSFLYVDDSETPGPVGIKLKHTAYRAIWDGAEDIYYKHEGRWLVYKSWDW